MGITYLITALLAIGAVYGVMQYWYGSMLTMHKHRLEDIVYIRKSTLLSAYIQHLETLQVSQKEAFNSALEALKDSFRIYQDSNFSSEFMIVSKDNGTYYFLYKNLNGQSFLLTEPLDEKSEQRLVNKAFKGFSGVGEEVNEYGVRFVTAYDYLDIGDRRVVLLASLPYSEISKPRYAAIFSAGVICFIFFAFGGLVFYVLSKKNYEEIRSADEQCGIFGYIMDSVKELVSYVDTKGRYVAVNESYQRIFGIPKEQIIGVHIREFHGERKYNEYLKGCFDTALSGKAVRHQIWYEFVSGYKRFFDISFVPHYIEGNINGVIVTANDITELETAKLELLKMTKDLKKLTMELEQKVRDETAKRLQHEQLFFEQKKFADMGQMINAIAHQWRQPINALGLYIQYIVESVADGEVSPEELEEFQNDSIGLVQHLSKTIDDFRGFFEPSKNKTEFQVICAVTETVSLVDAQLKSHFIEYTVSCQCAHKNFLSCNDTAHPPCEHPMTLVAGYPSEFKQVLMNLIQNAKDALEYKSIDKKLAVDIVASEDEIIVTVCDNGGGIPDRILGNIFDPYFTTKKEGKGTGIGLYMSKLIIEDHMDGKLTAYNNKEGACFEIKLAKLIPVPKQ